MIDAKTGTKHTAEAKAKMSAAQKRRGTRPPMVGRAWTAEEDEAVRTLTPVEAALTTKRTLSAVYSRRFDLKLADERA